MKRTKKVIAIVFSSILLLGSSFSVSVANSARTAGWCPSCKAATPFVRCSLCYSYDSNNPYHCQVCGTQQNHPNWGPCPSHR